MEWMGWFSFFIILCYASYPGRVKKLESKIKIIEKKQKGDNKMSKIINDLVGKNCKITTEDALVNEMMCTVLDADDEWIKFTYTDKKNNIKTKILRIDSIENIELSNE